MLPAWAGTVCAHASRSLVVSGSKVVLGWALAPYFKTYSKRLTQLFWALGSSVMGHGTLGCRVLS